MRPEEPLAAEDNPHVLNRLKALSLLSECNGDEIWSLEYCAERGVPPAWVEELGDCYESGFHDDSQTIYLNDRITNQYTGVRDVDLAIKLGSYLGVDVDALIDISGSRSRLVLAIKQAVEEQ
jgi:hypothetical protein